MWFQIFNILTAKKIWEGPRQICEKNMSSQLKKKSIINIHRQKYICGRDKSQSIQPRLLEEAEREHLQTRHQRHDGPRGDPLCNFIQLGARLPLHLNGVSAHCWDRSRVRILSRGETVPTCERGVVGV